MYVYILYVYIYIHTHTHNRQGVTPKQTSKPPRTRTPTHVTRVNPTPVIGSTRQVTMSQAIYRQGVTPKQTSKPHRTRTSTHVYISRVFVGGGESNKSLYVRLCVVEWRGDVFPVDDRGRDVVPERDGARPNLVRSGRRRDGRGAARV